MKKLLFICLIFGACNKSETTTPNSTTINDYTIKFYGLQYFESYILDSNSTASYYALNGHKTFLKLVGFLYIAPSPIIDSIENIKRGDVFELYIKMKRPCSGLGLSIYQYASDSAGMFYNRTIFAIDDSVFYPSPDSGTSAYLKYIAY